MRGCTLKGISDQTFSREEAEHFLARPELFPLCYSCGKMLREVCELQQKR